MQMLIHTKQRQQRLKYQKMASRKLGVGTIELKVWSES